jgi:vancomycin resistance protein YoaR
VTTTTERTTAASAEVVRRRRLLVGGIVAAVVAGLYLLLVLVSGDGLPRGATVDGVDIGGQSTTEAAATLTAALAPKEKVAIAATVGDTKVKVVPAAAGLKLDAAATVAQAEGRSWNPVKAFQRLTGSVALDPVVTVDDAKLGQQVAAIASDNDVHATEPSVLVRGTTITSTPGKGGQVLDQAAARQALVGAFLRTTDPVALPVVDSQPTVSADSAAEAEATAKALVSAPVSVHVGTITASIPAAVVADALSFSTAGGKLVPALDGAVLRSAIAPKLTKVETFGHDATWVVKSGKPVLVPSRAGTGVSPAALATSVLAAASTADGSRSVQATIGPIPPKLTTDQARKLGVVEKLSSFTQHFPYAAYRVQNIGAAAKSINGTLLLPGETFSLNKTLGERTIANGYTKGFVIGPGGVFKEDLGGGVSTSATATWTAAFYAGLQRIHTQAHSIWISRYRPGLEATVAWGQFDMSFRNDTPHGVFITTIMTNTSITVQIWGTKVYDKITAESGPRYDVSPPAKTQYDPTPTCHAQGGVEGFSIDVYRVFWKGGKEVKREKITTHYKPSPTVLCKADPSKATPSPSPSGSATGTGTPKPSPSPSATKKK